MDATRITLTPGMRYDLDPMRFCGWTRGDGSSTDGYNIFNYFSGDNCYKGADRHGIEPLFDPDTVTALANC